MSENTIRINNENGGQITPSGSALQFMTEMHSDIGICRQVNQDACCVRMMKIGAYSLILAAVCDGVGGLQEGDYASRSTIQALNNWFDYTVSRIVQGRETDHLMEYLQGEIEQCIQKQNHLICEYAQDKGIKTGTTLTLLVILNQRYITAQIGDSRAYRIRRELCQLTEDQSVVAQEVKSGRLSRREAKHDKRRNMILQCVGMSQDLQIAYKSGSVEREDVFFLCSDGFVHELEDCEIMELLKPELLVDQPSIKKCLINAVSLVKVRGEKDNITVVLIKELSRNNSSI